jgi:hypothetical protein
MRYQWPKSGQNADAALLAVCVVRPDLHHRLAGGTNLAISLTHVF